MFEERCCLVPLFRTEDCSALGSGALGRGWPVGESPGDLTDNQRG